MDELAYWAARRGANRLPCVFEKALLLRCAACALALPHALAERETLACTEPAAHADCQSFHRLLREKSLFALKIGPAAERISHAQEVRLQCGGLRGLQEALGKPPDVPPDVHLLLRGADIPELPYSRIIQGVSAWQGRKRTRPGDKA